MAREVERHLLVAEKTVSRMIEGSLAALASQNPVFVPEPGERGTLFSEFRNQSTQLGIVEMRAAGRAKFRRIAARPRFPVADQNSRAGLAKNKAQEIVLARPVQPSDEQAFGGRVPAQGVPASVENVSGSANGRDARERRRRDVIGFAPALIRIALSGKIEQIGTLRTLEPQCIGQSGQRVRRHRHVAALLDPGEPRGAQSAKLRKLLAPQARRPPPGAHRQAERSRGQPLPMSSDEVAEGASLLNGTCHRYGGFCTSIKYYITPV